MSKEQKGFIVYGEIKEVIDELPDDQVAKLFRGMVNYFVDGKDPKFSGTLKYIFIPIRQQMDRNSEKYEKRCEKNRENVKKRWEREKRTSEYERMQSNTNDTNTKTNTDTKTGRDINTESLKSDDPLSPENYIFMKGIV